MPIRTLFVAVLVLALDLNAQSPGRYSRGMPDSHPGDARLIGAVAGPPGRVVKGAPFSADTVTETTQTLADGNRIRQSSAGKMCRDSEGRFRTEQLPRGLGALTPGIRLPQVVFINDPVARVNWALNLGARTATRSAWERRDGGRPDPGRDARGGWERGPSPPGPGWRPSRPNHFSKNESLGKQYFEGIPAEGSRSTQSFPPGFMGNDQPLQIVSEAWFSPDLQTLLLMRHFDPRTGETVFRLINISREEPPAWLFRPPADFKITTEPDDPGDKRESEKSERAKPAKRKTTTK